MRSAILISLSALALAACGGASNTGASTASSTTNAATPAVTGENAPSATHAASGASATAGATLPAPRAGLWEITTTTTPAREGRGPRGPMRSCSDGETPARLGGPGAGAMRDPSCQPQVSQSGGATVLTTDCTTEGGVHIRSTTRITGDNQTAYQMRTERDVEGAPLPQMNGHRVTDVSARYVGECPANMPPGSIEIGGRVITREQMQQMGRGGRGMGGGMGG